jgi:hypothetical protein
MTKVFDGDLKLSTPYTLQGAGILGGVLKAD